MTDKPTSNSPFERARTRVSEGVEREFASTLLTPRKQRMCRAYVEHGTYVAAAAASGHSAPYCKKLIDTDEGVRSYIGKLVDQASTVTGVTLERVLEEYARLAFSDIGNVVDLLRAAGQDSDVALELLADLPADVTAAISEINITRKLESNKDGDEFVSGTMKLKMIDKKSALTDLGRMLSLFNDKITINDTSGFGVRLRRAMEKLEGPSPEGDGDE